MGDFVGWSEKWEHKDDYDVVDNGYVAFNSMMIS